jgi:hypothetical protein
MAGMQPIVEERQGRALGLGRLDAASPTPLLNNIQHTVRSSAKSVVFQMVNIKLPSGKLYT